MVVDGLCEISGDPLLKTNRGTSHLQRTHFDKLPGSIDEVDMPNILLAE